MDGGGGGARRGRRRPDPRAWGAGGEAPWGGPGGARGGPAGRGRWAGETIIFCGHLLTLWSPSVVILCSLLCVTRAGHAPPGPPLASGPGLAVLSAVLFGVSVPFAKLLLPEVGPGVLAGVFYLASGVGLLAVGLAARGFRGWRGRAAGRAARRVSGRAPGEVAGPHGGPPAPREARLAGRAWLWLGLAILVGGIGAPLLLLFGLARTSGATASLLLNLEGVFTALLAWAFFSENVGPRVLFGMALVAVGAGALAWTGDLSAADLLGPLLVAGACLCAALDNNLTRKVALGDPLEIATWKGLVAGSFNLALALSLGESLPPAPPLAAAAVVGFLGYGLSLALFVAALRPLGAARTAAYFSLAPFLGAIASVLVLGDPLTPRLGLAALLMGLGALLLLSERHAHPHAHAPLAHDHRHLHDEHHGHGHPGRPAPAGEPHSHPHVHAPLLHAHPHYPDAHHRHAHEDHAHEDHGHEDPAHEDHGHGGHGHDSAT